MVIDGYDFGPKRDDDGPLEITASGLAIWGFVLGLLAIAFY